MKGILIQSLIISFSMLVIPLFSISKPPKQATQTSATNSNIIYEKEETKDNIECFKVLKDGEICEVAVKDYIFGVVAAEMPALYHEEALKAQAVAAFTFACYKKQNNTNNEYDITVDPQTTQCYITREEAYDRWGEKADEYSQKIESCISAVEGQLLTYNNEVIFAAYHAISSGKTNPCSDVWGEELPYLKSVDSIGDLLADKYLSEAVFTPTELVDKLKGISESYGKPKDFFTDIVTTDNGYVKELTYCGKKVAGSKISELLGLRSTNFKVEFNGENFIFTIKGYGHGVGMSQNGANYMAQQGSTYQEILSHYYRDAVLQKN